MRLILFTAILLLFSLFSNCNSPWITPADTSAGALDVKAVVTDLPTADGKDLVVMQFFSGGKPVKFAAGETVSCNGVPLILNELLFGYAGRAPSAGPGSDFNFLYTRGGVQTNMSILIPPHVVFTSPLDGASVTRSNNYTITYVPLGGTGVNASGSGPAGNLNRNVFLPDNGTYTGMDTSTFGTGPGQLSLQRRFERPVSTLFHSARLQYDTTTTISVFWN